MIVVFQAANLILVIFTTSKLNLLGNYFNSPPGITAKIYFNFLETGEKTPADIAKNFLLQNSH